MRTSQIGIDLIKKWEGLRLKAYLCPAGVPTIGYGHTGDVKKGDIVTPKGAEELLRADLRRFEEGVSRLVRVKLNQGQFDALVSFSYNLGLGALSRSTLLKRVNKGDYYYAANEFLKWTRAGGKILKGLVARRKEERDLFITS